MSVKIRLARGGAKKVPYYRVVATDSREKRDGRFLEQLGIYDPTRDPAEFRVVADRVAHWIGVGATPSDTVRELLNRQKRTEKSA